MLGKLLKHELRASSRVMGPVIGALLLVSVMANFALRGMDSADYPTFVQVLCVIIAVLFFFGLMGVGIMAVVVMVRRFRQSLLQDEGYIMHTLPVSVHALVWSRIIASTLWFVATFAATVGAVLIAVMDVQLIHDLTEVIRIVVDYLFEGNEIILHGTTALLEFAGLAILGCIASSLTFYASMAVGHGFANKKALWSSVAFVVFIVAAQLVIGTASGLMLEHNIVLPFVNSVTTEMGMFTLICGYIALGIILYSAVFYVITVLALKKRLNLE